MSSRIVTRGIGCTLTILLLMLSTQAVDHEVHRRSEKMKTQRMTTVLNSRDLLERLNDVEPKASYSLQEATEHLLHYGALLRARILDTFGYFLYIHYDEFSVEQVGALHNVHRETLERRYNIFRLVTNVLRKPDTRPSRICAEIYALAEPCLKSRANVCRNIRKSHDLPSPDDDFVIGHVSNTTYLAYRSSKISKQYPEGFSLPALLKLLHHGILSITPSLLSGLLYHVRYDNYDDDVIRAERELIRYLHEIARTTRRSYHGVLEMMSPKELRRHHSVASFLKYYIGMHVERLASDKLKRHALLIVKHLVEDVDTIDENIHLLGNVYENDTIHVGYLFDLVLPDDVLHNDVIRAKRYLVNKLNDHNVLERRLRVSKYQQATPAHLLMEITGQLEDIGFAEDIATTLRIHARFWRRSYMVENLHELIRLFDAYENLRRVARYQDMMKNLDRIKRSLSGMQNVPVEILCSAPRACLRNGLRMLLDCKLVNLEIKQLIRDFLEQLSTSGAPLTDECLIPLNTTFRRKSNNKKLHVPKIGFSLETVESHEDQTKILDMDDISELETTEVESREVRTRTTTSRSDVPKEEENLSEATMASSESSKSEESSGRSSEIVDKTKEKTSEEIELSVEESDESSGTKTSTEDARYETTEPILAMTMTMMDKTPKSRQEKTVTSATSDEEVTTIATTTISEDEEIPNIDMEIERKRSTVMMSQVDDDDSDMDATWASSTTPTSIASIAKTSCESGECSGERSSKESGERHEESSTDLLLTTTEESATITTTQGFKFLETTGGASQEKEERTTLSGRSSSEEVSGETRAPPTEDERCTDASCSGECAGSKSESAESSDCRTRECDSLTEECDGENSGFEEDPNSSRKSDNNTAECGHKIACAKGSSSRVDECDTSQNDEKSDERCVRVCASREQTRESSCENQNGGDCSAAADGLPTVNLKLERSRNQYVCEIRDPHHRRQLSRLARMRAISATTSRHDDVLKSLRKSPRRRVVARTEDMQQQLLASRPQTRNESDKTKTAAERSVLGAFMKMKLKKEDSLKKKRTFGREQRDHQLYTLKQKLMTKRHGGKSSATRQQMYRSDRTSLRRGQTDRISKGSARSIVLAPLRDSATAYRDFSM